MLGLACLAALCIASLEMQDGTPGGALVFLVLGGAPLAWVGWWVQTLGYGWLGWMCLGVAALFPVAFVVRCILSAWPRSSNP